MWEKVGKCGKMGEYVANMFDIRLIDSQLGHKYMKLCLSVSVSECVCVVMWLCGDVAVCITVCYCILLPCSVQ